MAKVEDYLDGKVVWVPRDLVPVLIRAPIVEAACLSHSDLDVSYSLGDIVRGFPKRL